MVKWYSIRIILALTLVNKWHTQQIDYVLAYPQAPIVWEIQLEEEGFLYDRLCIFGDNAYVNRKDMATLKTFGN